MERVEQITLYLRKPKRTIPKKAWEMLEASLGQRLSYMRYYPTQRQFEGVSVDLSTQHLKFKKDSIYKDTIIKKGL